MSDYERYEFIDVRTRDGVTVCTLNRPEALNSVTRKGHRELEELFGQLAANREVKAVVLTGAGRAFCAGGDVKEMGGGDERPGGIFDSGARQLVANLLAVEAPIVAAVNGDAVGLGATLALLCDVVFVSESARIGDPHVRVGLVPGDGGAVIWPLLVGPARAKEYLMTGDLLAAAEAERIGLVNHVTAPEKLMEEAMAFAGRLGEGPALAIRLTKVAVQRAVLQNALDTLDMSLALEAITGRSADHAEAAAAFREKRKPKFEGR